MKRATIAVTALMAGLLTAPLAMAGTWTGWITDSNCGADGAKAEHKECAKRCHEKGGASLVFVNSEDKKIYQLDKQDVAAPHAGDQVKLTGEADGDKIKVESIAAAGDDAHAGQH
jgi:hypothetical protein